MKLKLKTLWTLLPLALLVGCGGEKEPEEPEVTFNLEEDLAKFYAENAETYQFKTLKDLPDDLKWESGADVRMRSDAARTLRVVRPTTAGGWPSVTGALKRSGAGTSATV